MFWNWFDKLIALIGRLLMLAIGLVAISGGWLFTLCVSKHGASGDPSGLLGWLFMALGLWVAVAALRAIWRIFVTSERSKT